MLCKIENGFYWLFFCDSQYISCYTHSSNLLNLLNLLIWRSNYRECAHIKGSLKEKDTLTDFFWGGRMRGKQLPLFPPFWRACSVGAFLWILRNCSEPLFMEHMGKRWFCLNLIFIMNFIGTLFKIFQKNLLPRSSLVKLQALVFMIHLSKIWQQFCKSLFFGTSSVTFSLVNFKI